MAAEVLQQLKVLIYLPDGVLRGASLEGMGALLEKIIKDHSPASPGQNVLKETFWKNLDLSGKKQERDGRRDKRSIMPNSEC